MVPGRAAPTASACSAALASEEPLVSADERCDVIVSSFPHTISLRAAGLE
jgi:hypothetical protein